MKRAPHAGWLWATLIALAIGTQESAFAQDDPFDALETEAAAEGDVADGDEDEDETEDEDEGETEDDDQGETEAGYEDEDEDDDETETETQAGDQPGRAVALVVAAGIGVGARGFERPTGEGSQRLPDTAFAAAEVLARAHVWPDDELSLEALLVYQSSIGLSVRERSQFALPQDVDARSARAELSLGPSLRLGDAADAARLVFPVGYSLRVFSPAVHQFRTPGYTLGGPHLRVELVAGLGESVELRIGPEAHWIVLIEGTVRDDGVCCQGFAVGGQGSLTARISRDLSVALAFRQSHAFADSSGARFVDVERILTTRLSGRL